MKPQSMKLSLFFTRAIIFVLLNFSHAFFFDQYDPDQPVLELENPVCKWNNQTSTCEKDPDAMIELLTLAGFNLGILDNDFAWLMRCQLSETESSCNSLSTCIWDQGACRISSEYLLNTISFCFQGNSSEIIECEEKFQTIGNTTTWIDRSTIRPVSICQNIVGDFSLYCTVYNTVYFFQRCYYSSTTCLLMESALEKDLDTYYGSVSSLTYQLLDDIRYIMGLSKSSVVLSLSYLEEKLAIKSGNLQLYESCGKIYDEETCESQVEKPSSTLSPNSPSSISSPNYSSSISSPNSSNEKGGSLLLILLVIPVVSFFVCSCCCIMRHYSNKDIEQVQQYQQQQQQSVGQQQELGNAREVQMTARPEQDGEHLQETLNQGLETMMTCIDLFSLCGDE